MKRLNVSTLHNGIEKTISKLRCQKQDFHRVEKEIHGIISLQDSLKGKGGEAIKAFYEDCHLPFLKHFHNFNTQYENALKQMQAAIQTLEPNADGYITQDFLEHDVNNGLDKLKNVTMALTDEANLIIESIQDIISLPKLDDQRVMQSISHAKQQVGDTVDQLLQFDHTQTRALTVVERDVATLKTFVTQIEDLFKSGKLTIANYRAGQLDKELAFMSITGIYNIAQQLKELSLKYTKDINYIKHIIQKALMLAYNPIIVSFFPKSVILAGVPITKQFQSILKPDHSHLSFSKQIQNGKYKNLSQIYNVMNQELINSELLPHYENIVNSLGNTFSKFRELSDSTFVKKVAPAIIKVMYGLGRNKKTSYTEDPINIASGNFIYQHKDIIIPGQSGLHLTRFYNSQDDQKNTFGKKWIFNFGVNLKLLNNYDIEVTFEDGHRELFENQGNDSYQSTVGSFNSLTTHYDGYTLILPSRETYFFNKAGRLSFLIDAKGAQTTFEYNTSGLLTRAKSDIGSLSFTYNNLELISSIEDHTGRNVSYNYHGENLISYTDPEGNSIHYQYNDNNLLTEIISPNNKGRVKNLYDYQGRVIEQTAPNGGVTSLTYLSDGFTTVVTNALGYETTFIHNNRYQLVKKILPTGEQESYSYTERDQISKFIDRRGHSTEFFYDTAGNCIEVKDSLNQTTLMAYNNHRMSKIIYPDGASHTFEYDEYGNVIQEKDPLNHTSNFTYSKDGFLEGWNLPNGTYIKQSRDANGNLASRINNFNQVTTYKYDSLNRIKTLLNAKGHSFDYEYNSNHQLTKLVYPDGSKVQLDYDNHGNLTSKTDQEGHDTYYEYDNFDKLIKITNAKGHVDSFEYDLLGQVIKQIDAKNNEISFSYDSLGRLETVTDQDSFITTYCYDAADNITKVTNPEGGETHFSYDALNRVTAIKNSFGENVRLEYDSQNRITKEIHSEKLETNYTYNLAGQLIKKIDSAGQKTSFKYNANNLLEKITLSDGSFWFYEYNALGQPIKITNPLGHTIERSYDETGQVISAKDPLGQQTTFVYDPMERLCTIIYPNQAEKSFTYTPKGLLSKVINENGYETEYMYDALNLLKEVKDPLGNITKYDYDATKNLTKVSRLNGISESISHQIKKYVPQNANFAIDDHSELVEQIVRYEYNPRGYLAKKTDSTGYSTTYSYDGLGNLINVIDRDNFATSYHYSKGQRLNLVKYGDGRSIAYNYTKTGQISEIEDWSGTTHFEYNSLGQLITVKTPNNESIHYKWTAQGQRAFTTYPDGYEVGNEYNSLGQLVKVTDSLKCATNYSYDENGDLASVSLHDGSLTTFKYDPLSRVTELSYLNSQDMVTEKHIYEYDPVGNRKKAIIFSRDEKPSDKIEYSYDALNQITEVKGVSGQHTRFFYDMTGNRLAELTQNNQTTQSGYVFNYDRLNRMKQRMDIMTLDKNYYSYDNRGNLLEIFQGDHLTQKHTFDATNQLVEAWTNMDVESKFTYNGLGQRIQKTISNSPTKETHQLLRNKEVTNPDILLEERFIQDILSPANHVLTKTTGDNKVHRYTYGINLIKEDILTSTLKNGNASNTNTQESLDTYSFKHNEQGSIVSSVRLKTEESKHMKYDTFGSPILKDSDTILDGAHHYSYTGLPYDKETGLYYAQARYYMPNTGRFISEDSWEGHMLHPNTTNPYPYVVNQPMTYTDTSGQKPENSTRGYCTENRDESITCYDPTQDLDISSNNTSMNTVIAAPALNPGIWHSLGGTTAGTGAGIAAGAGLAGAAGVIGFGGTVASGFAGNWDNVYVPRALTGNPQLTEWEELTTPELKERIIADSNNNVGGLSADDLASVEAYIGKNAPTKGEVATHNKRLKNTLVNGKERKKIPGVPPNVPKKGINHSGAHERYIQQQATNPPVDPFTGLSAHSKIPGGPKWGGLVGIFTVSGVAFGDGYVELMNRQNKAKENLQFAEQYYKENWKGQN
ncbi:T7SS effector LXG polymorphic toxin [Salipaludibacillus agaradhaerens]|uniref:T7SS effector LXG polymorphic toxin n=1 Tax=Salipaludibacillus agaradhaerens TaxID=76935 RepID=UPI000996C3CD|nr:T7SS effector LXG polymorphic toxin [Salipaludibacillus agaradhaerens]